MYHVLTDHLGSLITVINAETNQLQRYSYSSWGLPQDSNDWTSRYTGELFACRGLRVMSTFRECLLQVASYVVCPYRLVRRPEI